MSEQPQSDADILKALAEMEKSRDWVSKNYDELRTKHQGKVFAVKDEGVVESSDRITDLLETVEKKGEASAYLLIESIPPKGVVYIL